MIDNPEKAINEALRRLGPEGKVEVLKRMFDGLEPWVISNLIKESVNIDNLIHCERLESLIYFLSLNTVKAAPRQGTITGPIRITGVPN